MKIVDLSRELYHRTPSYPGQPPIIHGVWKSHAEAKEESGGVHGNSVMFFSMPDQKLPRYPAMKLPTKIVANHVPIIIDRYRNGATLLTSERPIGER